MTEHEKTSEKAIDMTDLPQKGEKFVPQLRTQSLIQFKYQRLFSFCPVIIFLK